MVEYGALVVVGLWGERFAIQGGGWLVPTLLARSYALSLRLPVRNLHSLFFPLRAWALFLLRQHRNRWLWIQNIASVAFFFPKGTKIKVRPLRCSSPGVLLMCVGHACCTASLLAELAVIRADLLSLSRIRWHRARQGGPPAVNHTLG